MPRDTDSIHEEIARAYVRRAFPNSNELPWRLAARLQKIGLIKIDLEPARVEGEFAELLGRIEDGDLDALIVVHVDETNKTYFETVELLRVQDIEFARKYCSRLIELVNRVSKSSLIRSLSDSYIASLSRGVIVDLLDIAARLDEALESDLDWQLNILQSAVKHQIDPVIFRQIDLLCTKCVGESYFLELLAQRFSAASAELKSPRSGGATGVSAVDLAHLPWRPGAFADLFVSGEGSLDDLVNQWLEQRAPGIWFQAWLISASNPAMVSPSTWDAVWDRLAELVAPEDSEPSFIHLYRTLVRNFVFRLEAVQPGIRSDFSLWSASYLATCVSGALANSDLSKIFPAILVAETNSGAVWQAVGCATPFSAMRAAFRSVGDLWSIAVQASADYVNFDLVVVPEALRPALLSVARDVALVTIATNGASQVQPEVEGICDDLNVVRAKWNDVLADQELAGRLLFAQVVQEKFNGPDAISQRMEEPFGDEIDLEGRLVVGLWASMVERGAISITSAVDLVRSRKWTEFIEPTVDDSDLDAILSALLMSRWDARPSIGAELSHWAAHQCISLIEHERRRKRYFFACVFFCLHGGLISAIERIVAGDRENRLESERLSLVHFLQDVNPSAPAWIQMRVRAVLSVLSNWKDFEQPLLPA